MGIYHFDSVSDAPIYSVDTPPPTVSGKLHLGHVYSYSHADFFARFWRMNGRNVFYPMGYDDNGLPTERLVEKSQGIDPRKIDRQDFIEQCLHTGEIAEKEYKTLWIRLGLSVDWRYTYRTIDVNSRRLCQWSFIDLYQRGLAYRKEAPAIWCPKCQTAIAQAELNDLERESEFVTLKFVINTISSTNQQTTDLLIATTRPELLPACVAIFVHPEDIRYQHLVGQQATVPIFGQGVPILADPAADPEKGTGAVMCCTFGDTTDVTWWRTHQLPLIKAIDHNGHMTSTAGRYAGQSISDARKAIRQDLETSGFVIGHQATNQSIRIHERCDTPVEYLLIKQWFINVLDHKGQLLKAGEEISWHPQQMAARYRAWVENLNWDWCISRQRFFGVPFPVWYCKECGETILAEITSLPVDPSFQSPNNPCPNCGSNEFIPEKDIFDTWMTSSMSPQIVKGWNPKKFREEAKTGLGNLAKLSPYTLRPQSHEIIRTWTFYTIVKSLYHFDTLPWTDALISGWGLAGEGMGKISKSRGGGPMAPLEMIEKYSADAVRYWAASTAPGKDSVINEEKIQMGGKFITKLWNVARFSERFIIRDPQPFMQAILISPADRWILARAQRMIQRVTELFNAYEYAAAKNESESFFWGDLTDNYLEMAKQRLYDPSSPTHDGARHTVSYVLLTVIKLFAPLLPHVTEEIYQWLFNQPSASTEMNSIHRASWPQFEPVFDNPDAESFGEILVEIATAVRRYKSEHNLSLGSELKRIQLAVESSTEQSSLKPAIDDLKSITRAQQIEITKEIKTELFHLPCKDIELAIEPL